MTNEREELAAYAHEAWSGWMRYMFKKGTILKRKADFVLPSEFVLRWIRQMNTPYSELPENEKESDRKEADEILRIIRKEEIP